VNGLSNREAAQVAIDAIQTLSADVGIPSGLAELGVKTKDLKIMAKNAMKDACGSTNPRVPTLDNVIDIYKSAL
jgi:alcohol dehydrogenase